MSKLFENSQINTLELKNHFVRSATWEGMAGSDGSCTPLLIETMANLAKGGVGLIISGHSYIQAVGQAGPNQLAINDDKHIPGLRKMTDAVHKEGGKIIVQLAHAGCQADTKLSGMEAVGPSVFEVNGNRLCREITHDEISETVRLFGEAADRAKKAGFDGVQIHAAHGYLFCEFLSPFYNKRTDEYGGSLENRARIVLESYRAIRETVGSAFPVLIKINSEDFLENGLTVKETIEVSGMLEKEGIDAIEMSGGTIQSDKKLVPVRAGIDSEEKEVFYREAATSYKKQINVPLILVGGVRSYNIAEQLIADGITDYISLSRPLIREPGLINRWKSGDHSKAECISCNGCFRPAMKGEGIYCVVKKKEEEKKQQENT